MKRLLNFKIGWKMKKIKIYNLIILLIGLVSITLFYQCSSSVPQKEIGEVETEIVYEDEIRLNVKRVLSWINAMPGAEKRFHVSGELEILDNSNYDYQMMDIKKITVLQEERLIFIFTPKVIEELKPNKKNMIFSTVRGLIPNAALNQKKPIDIVVKFDDGSTELKYKINKVTIELAL